jgi:hypothetical protein
VRARGACTRVVNAAVACVARRVLAAVQQRECWLASAGVHGGGCAMLQRCPGSGKRCN